MSGWVLDWEEAAKAGAPVCGGKGWNLGRLHRYGFPVPRGGVLVASAYDRMLESEGLKRLTLQTAAWTGRDVSTPEVINRLSAIQGAVESAPLPAEVVEALAEFLARTGLDSVPVAVRSSATLEDGQEHSFAGIHQSFLNVRGTEGVLAAVRKCYASLWTPQAVAYRRHRNLPDSAVSCAVVICAMVTKPGAAEPVSAGVAFSCDPKTGRRDLITISAAPGIGEQVVSGQVNPEEISISTADGTYSLAARTGRPNQVLTDQQALRLARTVDRVHWALGDAQAPQDVEWAFDGERFWLLQARPVTRLPRVTFPEVAHLPVIWSNANLKDTMVHVQSPLGWHIIRNSLSSALYGAVAAAGYPIPRGMEIARRFAGRPYFDLTAFSWAYFDGLAIVPKELNRMLGGHQPEIPVPKESLYAGAAGRRRIRGLIKFSGSMRRAARELPALMEGMRRNARTASAVDLRPLSNQQLLALWKERQAEASAFSPKFMLANTASGFWHFPLVQLMERLAGERGHALVTGLVSGAGSVVSAEHGFRLFDLAAAAAEDPAARDYLLSEPLNPQGWKDLPASSPFRAAFAAFLQEFGHRGVFEVEIANPRWIEDPTYLLEQVRHLVKTGRTRAPRENAPARREAAEAEVNRLTFFLRPFIHWMAEQVRKGSALRERAKSALVVNMLPFRRMALEIGGRLVEQGHLDQADDIFYLSFTDMEQYLTGEWEGTGARALVADRRARDEAWDRESPPDIILLDAEGRPAALPAEIVPAAVEKPRATRVDGGLKGVGVSGGRVTGVARIIRNPADGARLADGEILVAPSTDPGWTPLFLRAGAVAMEIGGYLSHGAIVSRECGLPAVVNIPGLLGLVREGQRITVDGDAGLIILHEADAECAD